MVEHFIVTTAMDEVRKLEQKDADDKKSLFRSRRLFMEMWPNGVRLKAERRSYKTEK